MSMVDYSMFVEELGQDEEEVESYCERCQSDTLHTKVGRYGEKIRRVRCNVCEDIHLFRSPSSHEEVAETTNRKKAPKVKPTWEQVMSKNKKDPKTYNVNEVFNEMDIIAHPSFGVGFVSQLIGYDKIEVTFEHSKRILIHNRLGRPIVLTGIAHREQDTEVEEDELFEGPDEFSSEGHEFDEFLEMEDDDLMMGEPTKLSPQAWAALHEEDEEEKPNLQEDDSDSLEDDETFVSKTSSKKTKGRLLEEDDDEDEFFDEDEDMDDDDEDEEEPVKKKSVVAKTSKNKKGQKSK